MKKNKTLLIITAALLVLLVLVFVRAFNSNLFKRDAGLALLANEKHTIAMSNLAQEKDYTILQLDENRPELQASVYIPFEQLLDKTNQKKLAELNGKILLFSENINESAKAWVLLNQLGFDNVFILSEEDNPEALKYEFQPDTTARLE